MAESVDINLVTLCYAMIIVTSLELAALMHLVLEESSHASRTLTPFNILMGIGNLGLIAHWVGELLSQVFRGTTTGLAGSMVSSACFNLCLYAYIHYVYVRSEDVISSLFSQVAKWGRMFLALSIAVFVTNTVAQGLETFVSSIKIQAFYVNHITGLLGGFMTVSFDLFCMICYCRLMLKTRHDDKIDPHFLIIARYGAVSSLFGVFGFAVAVISAFLFPGLHMLMNVFMALGYTTLLAMKFALHRQRLKKTHDYRTKSWVSKSALSAA
ncbi:hypothetical protein BC830DRAFT_1166743 [Chytriomyces sp. MP71]|nr:hypothetical protein BC830DRAFT_1166743 [Chytriomyces sp. MP71]